MIPVTHTGSVLERMVCDVTLRVSLVEPPSDVVPQPGHKELGQMIRVIFHGEPET